MPNDLPGYYFDSSKNRYFKIQANHVANGPLSTASKYSRQAVRAEKAIKKSERRQKSLQLSKDAVTVKRSRLLQHPLLNFQTRLGDRRKSAGDIVKEYYAASLTGAPAIAPPRNPNERRRICDKFAIENESGLLLTVTSSEREPQIESVVIFQPDPAGLQSHYLYPRGQIIPDMSVINNVDHILSLGTSGITVWGHHHPRLPPGATDTSSTLSLTRHFPPQHNERAYDGVGMQFRLMERITDLTATPSNDRIAISHSTGVSVMSDLRTSQKLTRVSSRGESTAVWFKDENVLLYGARNGRLRMCDIRSPEPESVLRVQHTSAISHIRSLGAGGNQILINGLMTMAIYDLRYSPRPTISKQRVPRGKPQDGRSPTYTSTPPYLTFSIPETRHQNRYGLGFAYDADHNMVLSASTDFHRNHRVNLWDANTGRLLESPLVEHRFEAPVTCADIVDVRHGAKSILLATSGQIQEWSTL